VRTFVIYSIYSDLVGERSIVISLSVCLSPSIALEPLDWSSQNFFVQIPCGCGLVLLWQRCDILCTSSFMSDVMFGRTGPYGEAWKAEPLTYYH